MKDSERIRAVIVGGYTRRWHADDIVGEERVDSHTWGMLALIHLLHPNPSVALLGAVTFHDSPGEPFSGDIPHYAKVAFPELGDADHSISDRVCKALGLNYELTDEDLWWLSFTDAAQAYLFLKRQVAQGNSLMAETLAACDARMLSMTNAPNRPVNSKVHYYAIIGCLMDRHMSRDLRKLEKMA